MMMQIIEQTHDEAVAMYMKGCTKKQLAEMLASCNELLKQRPPSFTVLSECNHHWITDTGGTRCTKCGERQETQETTITVFAGLPDYCRPS